MFYACAARRFKHLPTVQCGRENFGNTSMDGEPFETKTLRICVV